MVTRLVDEAGNTLAEGDIESLLDGMKAREGRIKYHSTTRSVTPVPTQHTDDVWATYTEKKALQYTVPAWAVDEMRLRLGRTVRFLTWKHSDVLEDNDAARFKLTMRVENEQGELVGNGQPQRNKVLADLPSDTLVLLNFQLHLPMNRGRSGGKTRAAATPRTGRRRSSARKKAKLSVASLVKVKTTAQGPPPGGPCAFPEVAMMAPIEVCLAGGCVVVEAKPGRIQPLPDEGDEEDGEPACD